MPNQEEPALTLDRALWYGRTYRAHSASTAEETSPQFLKRLQKLQTKKSPTFLCLRTGGLIQDASWEEDSALLGEFSMRSFLEYHNGGVESRLSQILQGGQLRKYYLSAKACQGILNRAKRRGKELPEMLRIALEQQSASLNEPDAPGGGKGILIQDDQTGTLSTVNNQAVCYGICSDKSNSMLSGNPHSGIYEADTSRTLDNNCGNPACNQGGIAVVEQETASGVICLNPHDSQSARVYDANGVWHSLNANSNGGQSRDAVCYPINTMIATRGKALGRGTGFGVGDDGDAQFTLSTTHEHAVCYPEVSRTLSARYDSSPCIDRGQEFVCYESE